MANTFAERAKALIESRHPRAADTAKLIEEADKQIASIEADLARLNEIAESIDTDEAAARDAVREAGEQNFTLRRTKAMREKLNETHQALMESERRKAIRSIGRSRKSATPWLPD